MTAPNMFDSAGILRLAADLSDEQADKMAHALGWPDTLNVHRPRGRVKWANPYRNYYCGQPDDAAWMAAQALGLADVAPDGRWAVWRVTPLGRRVVRLRLLAVQQSRPRR
jgi:ligand-binding sensor domain-containing protein